jgi:hypothetical protein
MSYFIDLIISFFIDFLQFLEDKFFSFFLKKTNDFVPLDINNDCSQLDKEIKLVVKIKIYIEPKKSIYFLYGKKNQKIIILGKKTIDEIKWSKVRTENGDEGWCII